MLSREEGPLSRAREAWSMGHWTFHDKGVALDEGRATLWAGVGETLSVVFLQPQR